MHEIRLDGIHNEGRGRNGWFRPKRAWVVPRTRLTLGDYAELDKPVLELSVYSKRAGRMPPVLVILDKEDWFTLALELLAYIKDASPEDIKHRLEMF